MQDVFVDDDHHGRADRDPGKDVEEEQFHRSRLSTSACGSEPAPNRAYHIIAPAALQAFFHRRQGAIGSIIPVLRPVPDRVIAQGRARAEWCRESSAPTPPPRTD